MAEVKILSEGYSKEITENRVKAEGTITLVKSIRNIIIDTGNVGSGQKIVIELSKENLKPEDIDIVVNTHGDLDHVGNNNLFNNAKFVGFGSICKGDEFDFFKDEFIIDKDIKIIKTPGHGISDLTLMVKTERGIVAVTGDIFENGEDINGEEAKKYSVNWKRQLESRNKILEIADYIIPGHGGMFKVER